MHPKMKRMPRTEPSPNQINGLVLAAYFVLVLLIGGNFVAVRFSSFGLPPFWGAGIRFLAASLLLFIYAAVRRHPLPKGRALAGAVLFGFLQYGLFYALAYFAMVEVTAGLAAVISAAAPIFTLVFAGAARIETLTRWGVLGAAVSFSGIAFIFGSWAGKEIPVLYLLAAVGAVVVGALAAILFKLLPPVHPHAINAVGMLSGALFLLVLSFLAGEKATLPPDVNTWAAFIYLVLPGSVFLFGLFLFVLKRWKASAAAYQTVLSPIVTILLSAWLLAEPVSERLFLGSALVFAGVSLVILSPSARRKCGNRLKERPEETGLKVPCSPC